MYSGQDVKPVCFVVRYHLLHIGRQLCEQLRATLHPAWHARRTSGHQQADERCWLVVEDVLHGQLPTPRAAEEVEADRAPEHCAPPRLRARNGGPSTERCRPACRIARSRAGRRRSPGGGRRGPRGGRCSCASCLAHRAGRASGMPPSPTLRYHTRPPGTSIIPSRTLIVSTSSALVPTAGRHRLLGRILLSGSEGISSTNIRPVCARRSGCFNCRYTR